MRLLRRLCCALGLHVAAPYVNPRWETPWACSNCGALATGRKPLRRWGR